MSAAARKTTDDATTERIAPDLPPGEMRTWIAGHVATRLRIAIDAARLDVERTRGVTGDEWAERLMAELDALDGALRRLDHGNQTR